MNIAINTRLLLPNKMDGIGWFTFETVRRIVTQHPEHKFYFLFDRKPDPQFLFAPNVHPVVLFPPSRHPILWYLFFEWSIPYALRKYKIDLFLSPDAYSSLRTRIPKLTVIHDINFEHTPGNLKPSHQIFLNYYSRRYAQQSTRVATVSEYSKQDLIETYQLMPDKIDVVYNGAHEDFRPLSLEQQQQVREQYADGKRYFIFVSTIIKRKNLATLLKAFDQLCQCRQEEMRLIVVGNRVWWKDELQQAYEQMQHRDRVKLIGRASSKELVRLMGAATAMVYPSLFEGFGIPILEAFHAEVPVITSNCTSMPEVAGPAALLVEPTDTEAMCQAMMRCASDPELCQQLISLGRQQRQHFSWDITAHLLWESMAKTYHSATK